ncbi:MAG: hypothetical protein A2X43_09950 [Candidatus Margulisbacteria bacterium GWD2_39_127]|nr:MAG: hypothetical protein A2X43_09950 [Candidatus Margulisbacteria bacterium GWD2_39_127]OGI07675.1 MAG: hypothetical protein A2X41_04560 [Candidatus Margulisbacteria bacterium GWE2_39_32]
MFQNMSIMEFLQQGGYVLLLLSICSVVSFSVMLERFIVMVNLKSKTKKFIPPLIFKLKKHKYDEALAMCEENMSVVGNLFLSAIERKDKQKIVIEEAMQRNGAKLALYLEKRLSILATLGSISPFIGLFGTVVGIIKTFHSLSLTDAYSSNLVSNGIAEALINTAAGLFVAIPAVIAFNYFTHKIQLFLKELEIASSEAIELLTE